jgi:hypothetical protein
MGSRRTYTLRFDTHYPGILWIVKERTPQRHDGDRVHASDLGVRLSSPDAL